MKSSIVTIILSLSLISAFCQQNNSELVCHPDGIVFNIVEEMPILQISLEELKNYMSQNIETIEMSNGEAYEFYLRFIVNCRGITGDYVFFKSGLESLNGQIISALKKKCTWIPGVQKNTNVDVYYSFSITLKNKVFDIELKNYRPLGK